MPTTIAHPDAAVLPGPTGAAAMSEELYEATNRLAGLTAYGAVLTGAAPATLDDAIKLGIQAGIVAAVVKLREAGWLPAEVLS